MQRHLASITAIIRKDLRLLWPWAIAIALAQFLMPALFSETSEFGRASLRLFGSRMLVGIVQFGWIALFAALVIFIVLVVHQDAPADRRRDFLIRPIPPLDLIAAKAAIILGAVFVPSVLGNTLSALTEGAPPMLVLMQALLTLHLCVLVAMLAWLASSPLQALLAVGATAIAIVILLSAGVAVGIPVSIGISEHVDARSLRIEEIPEPVSRAMPYPAPAAQSVASVCERDSRPCFVAGEGILALETILLLAASGATLWLLLARRKLVSARLTFLAFLLVEVGFLFALSRPQMVDIPLEMPMPMPAPDRAEPVPAPYPPTRPQPDRAVPVPVPETPGFVPGRPQRLGAPEEKTRDEFIIRPLPEPPATEQRPAPENSNRRF